MNDTTKAAVRVAAGTEGGRAVLAFGGAVTGVAAAIGIVVVILAASVGAGSTANAATLGCAGGGTAQTVASIQLTAAQLGNAQTIVTTAAAYRAAGAPLPAYAATVALATSYQESKFVNSTSQVDHDSEGLFQQRVSIYTAAVAANPVKSTQAFLVRLVKVANWQTIALTDAAADVQIPAAAYRGLYAQWQPLAAALTSQLWPAARAANSSTAPTSTTVLVPVAACTGDGGAGLAPAHGHGNNVAGTSNVPAGLVIAGSPAGRKAVAFALAQLGKPYVFNAAGPTSFDCSGLTMAAWATAGVTLDHFTGSQVSAGTPEPLNLSQAVAGDLVLIPGADGTTAKPGHVGMIIGYTTTPKGRRLYLIQAPETGMNVEVTDTSEWAGQIAAVRHIG